MMMMMMMMMRLSLGVLPNKWKLAEVTAIYKKGRNLTEVTIGQLV